MYANDIPQTAQEIISHQFEDDSKDDDKHIKHQPENYPGTSEALQELAQKEI